MMSFFLVVHIIIVIALIILVLLQRSEGGALGIGGGGGGFVGARSLGNAMTRATAILVALFFASSILLAILGTIDNKSSVLDDVIENPETDRIIAPVPLAPSEPDLPQP